ncbi:MAG TPA: FecR domain-containing protein [Flavobacterium sp.]|jgi:ferric-dicitrate binding protein FerR (iron transport regulator)
MNANNKHGDNTTFLSDWLAGKLSDEQLKERVSDADFAAYQQIRELTTSIGVADPDMNANYLKVRERLKNGSQQKETTTRRLYPFAAIAAALLTFFGLYQFFAFSNSNFTAIGQTSIVHLKDNSAVTLNANSTISYPGLFNYNRKVKLKGEAFFNVAKGRSFIVETQQGSVEVLGTSFNVISRAGFFEVICFEGLVEVNSKGQSVLLRPGDAIRLLGGQLETWSDKQATQPTWINGESSFSNVPFHFVIAQLQNQYHVDVQYPQKLEQTKFSGAFPNNEIDAALQSICLPLNLEYKKTTGGKIIISE